MSWSVATFTACWPWSKGTSRARLSCSGSTAGPCTGSSSAINRVSSCPVSTRRPSVPQKPDPRFLAITAHDLRGAVGVLEGAMKELTREVEPDNTDAAKLTLMMTRSTQRLLLLGDRLSVLARLMDEAELELGEPTDLSALVKDAVARAFSAHARRTLRLHVEAPPAPVLWPLNGQTMSGAISELSILFC